MSAGIFNNTAFSLLPQECNDAIVDYGKEDRDFLLSCSLTHPAFHRRTVKYTFASIDVRGPVRIKQCLDLIAKNNEISKHVISVTTSAYLLVDMDNPDGQTLLMTLNRAAPQKDLELIIKAYSDGPVYDNMLADVESPATPRMLKEVMCRVTKLQIINTEDVPISFIPVCVKLRSLILTESSNLDPTLVPPGEIMDGRPNLTHLSTYWTGGADEIHGLHISMADLSQIEKLECHLNSILWPRGADAIQLALDSCKDSLVEFRQRSVMRHEWDHTHDYMTIYSLRDNNSLRLLTLETVTYEDPTIAEAGFIISQILRNINFELNILERINISVEIDLQYTSSDDDTTITPEVSTLPDLFTDSIPSFMGNTAVEDWDFFFITLVKVARGRKLDVSFHVRGGLAAKHREMYTEDKRTADGEVFQSTVQAWIDEHAHHLKESDVAINSTAEVVFTNPGRFETESDEDVAWNPSSQIVPVL